MLEIMYFILHIDSHMQAFISNYGAITYAIIFAIVFVETGVVFFPFLPGDSLIFICGALAAKGWLSWPICFLILCSAAVIGDNTNRLIGHRLGRRIFKYRYILTPENLAKTEEYFKKHGTKTIILARFVPFFRTFVPFVSGIGKMEFKKFFLYDLLGGLAWVTIFLSAGFFFGNIPAVKENFSLVILAIIALSVIPGVYEYLARKLRKGKQSRESH